KLFELLKEVLELQPSWASLNTPEMQRRGVLIRQQIPDVLREMLSRLGPDFSELRVEGRDGTGRKTRVPWVRIYSPDLSPSATEGWYVVFLFAADGSAVYLSLNQGTTIFHDGTLTPRDPEELRGRVEIARRSIAAN